MKNLINYYYNILIDEFKKIDNYFVFKSNNNYYEFLPLESDINLFYKTYALVKTYKYCHEVIVNKDNSIITYYENMPYVLIKKDLISKRALNIDDILEYDIPVFNKYEMNWKNLWKEKNDYYEYQINQLGFKYPIIRQNFSYYLGLSELAINILNYVDNDQIKSYISHKRINYKESLDKFYNPINLMIDSRVRDVSEYLKINYLNNNLDINNVYNILNNINFSYDESLLLLARLFYPSYYFDIYDKIIQGKCTEEKVLKYTKKNAYYETFLKSIYTYIRNRYNIPEIEWLETKVH